MLPSEKTGASDVLPYYGDYAYEFEIQCTPGIVCQECAHPGSGLLPQPCFRDNFDDFAFFPAGKLSRIFPRKELPSFRAGPHELICLTPAIAWQQIQTMTTHPSPFQYYAEKAFHSDSNFLESHMTEDIVSTTLRRYWNWATD